MKETDDEEQKDTKYCRHAWGEWTAVHDFIDGNHAQSFRIRHCVICSATHRQPIATWRDENEDIPAEPLPLPEITD